MPKAECPICKQIISFSKLDTLEDVHPAKICKRKNAKKKPIEETDEEGRKFLDKAVDKDL